MQFGVDIEFFCRLYIYKWHVIQNDRSQHEVYRNTTIYRIIL